MATTVSRRSSVADPPRVVVSKRTRAAIDADARPSSRCGGELDAAALNTLVDTFDDAIAPRRLRRRGRPRRRRLHRRGVDRRVGAQPGGRCRRRTASSRCARRRASCYRLLELCGLVVSDRTDRTSSPAGQSRVRRDRQRRGLELSREPAREIAALGVGRRRARARRGTRPRPRRGGRAGAADRRASPASRW